MTPNRSEAAGQDLSGLTVTELISLALEWTGDDHEFWDPVCELQARGSGEVFAAARELLRDGDPQKRTLGVDILAQLGFKESPISADRPYHGQPVDLLLGLLEREEDSDVLASIASAFGHLGDVRAIPPLVKLARHHSEDVRWGAAFGLGGHSDRRAIRAMIRLTRDEDADVRDWATFGLGTLIDNNTREIRDALFARVTDPDREIRGEAFRGLAVRRDSRVVEPLIKELQAPDMEDDRPGSLVLDAAAELADPRLYPHLVELRGECDREALDEAIERCRPQHQQM